jgi:uncharacterized membrane-anchored protein
MLTHLVESWASLYSNHPALRTGVGFLHVGGLVVGGGCAIAADRITLRVVRGDVATRTAALHTLDGTHHVVIAALAVVIASGVLMFGADVDTFLYSKFFWLKMALVVLLLANGNVLLRAEHRIEAGDLRGWTRLTLAARASVVLWMLTTLAGVALPNT